MLSAAVLCFAGCVSAPPQPVTWYAVSPVATSNHPHGDVNSTLSSWEKVKDFPTADTCEDELQGIHNQLHRPVGCVASNDPRLAQE
jgi:hypothetical protein